MGLNLIIKSCKKTDYQFCYNLSKANMQKYFENVGKLWKEENFKKDFNINEVKIITLKDEKIGYYTLKENKEYFYLDNIQIEKEYQNKGVGTKIMILVEKEVKKSKTPVIRLTVFKDNPALNFYKKLGYEIKEDKGDSVLLQKHIF